MRAVFDEIRIGMLATIEQFPPWRPLATPLSHVWPSAVVGGTQATPGAQSRAGQGREGTAGGVAA